jgi:hypothetical protein
MEMVGVHPKNIYCVVNELLQEVLEILVFDYGPIQQFFGFKVLCWITPWPWYTVILVRPETGESAQLSFTPKFVGEILPIWVDFVQCPRQKFADLGEIRTNRQNFARNFLGRNLTAWIRPFRTSFAQKNYCVECYFSKYRTWWYFIDQKFSAAMMIQLRNQNFEHFDDIFVSVQHIFVYLSSTIIFYTVDIFSGEPGEAAQLRFALKNFGQIYSDLGVFRPLFSRRICCLGEISPKSKEIRPKFLGRNLTARITVYVSYIR